MTYVFEHLKKSPESDYSKCNLYFHLPFQDNLVQLALNGENCAKTVELFGMKYQYSSDITDNDLKKKKKAFGVLVSGVCF